MVTPAHFFSHSYASFDEAFGLANLNANIPLNQINKANIGSSFFAVFSQYGPLAAKIVYVDHSNNTQVIGSGGWISNQLFITAAHVLKTALSSTFIQSSSGDILSLNGALEVLDLENDFAVFRVNAPSTITAFPQITDPESASLSLGMIHFAKASPTPLVTIGSRASNSYFELSQATSIDGGKGSSGGLIFDSNGSLVFMNLCELQEGSGVRSHISIVEILSHVEKTGSTLREKLYIHEIPEHGFLDTLKEPDNSKKASLPLSIIKKGDFERADAFIRKIIVEDLTDFYARAFGAIGTIFSEGDLRLDIQNPTKTATNLQLQCGDYTLATVQIPYVLSYFSEAKGHLPLIVTVAKYSLGQLLVSLNYAKDNYKTITCKVQQKKLNHFNLNKIANKVLVM